MKILHGGKRQLSPRLKPTLIALSSTAMLLSALVLSGCGHSNNDSEPSEQEIAANTNVLVDTENPVPTGTTISLEENDADGVKITPEDGALINKNADEESDLGGSEPATGIIVPKPKPDDLGSNSSSKPTGPLVQPSHSSTGETLLGGNQAMDSADAKGFAPASTTKLLTTGIALELLGPSFTFKQSFKYQFVVDSKTQITNFHWTDDGDPTLGHELLEVGGITARLNSMAKALQTAGVKTIVGKLAMDAEDSRDDIELVIPGIDGGDRSRCYGAPLYAFNYNRNCTTSYRERALTNPHPRATLKLAFVNALRRHGITVVETSLAQGAGPVENLTFESPDLKHIIFEMNKVSDNQLAESLFRAISKRVDKKNPIPQVGHAYYEAVLARWMNNLGVGQLSNEFYILDGAGLSSKGEATPRAFAHALKHIASQQYFATVWASLPIAGGFGTLANRMPQDALRGKVRAKTGTLLDSGYYNLAGYIPVIEKGSININYVVPFVIFTKAQGGHASENAVHHYQDKLVAQLMTKINANRDDIIKELTPTPTPSPTPTSTPLPVPPPPPPAPSVKKTTFDLKPVVVTPGPAFHHG